MQCIYFWPRARVVERRWPSKVWNSDANPLLKIEPAVARKHGEERAEFT